MAVVNLDLIGSFAITQGYEWRVNLYHPGNIINVSPWGQVWADYAPGNGMAQFSFERATYDPVLDLTKIPAVINSFITKELPLTGSGFFVYEIRFSLTGKPAQQMMAGRVHVLPSLGTL